MVSSKHFSTEIRSSEISKSKTAFLSWISESNASWERPAYEWVKKTCNEAHIRSSKKTNLRKRKVQGIREVNANGRTGSIRENHFLK